jgi:hypothetical protein
MPAAFYVEFLMISIFRIPTLESSLDSCPHVWQYHPQAGNGQRKMEHVLQQQN